MLWGIVAAVRCSEMRRIASRAVLALVTLLGFGHRDQLVALGSLRRDGAGRIPGSSPAAG